MVLTVTRASFTDFESLQDHLVPDNTWGILPLDSGPMTGTATHLSFGPGFAITDGSFSRGIRAVGVASPDRWMIAGLCKGWAVSHGGRMGAGDLTILAPGRELYVRFSNQTRYFAALIAPEEAWAFLASHSRAFEDLEHHQLAVLNVPPEIARSNVHQLNILIHALKLHGANMSDAMVDYYKRSILDILMRPLSSTVHHHDDAGIMAMSLVREVDRYIMKPGIRPLHVSELCEHFAVHEKKLQRAFNEVLGITPATFLRNKRLADAHAAFRNGANNIKSVAMARGFLNVGKFAKAFRQLFGELPHETVRKNTKFLLGLLPLLWLTPL